VKSILQVWMWRVDQQFKDGDMYYAREYAARLEHDNNAMHAECEGEKERTASWDETYHRMWSFR
jgi:hypothetical protein